MPIPRSRSSSALGATLALLVLTGSGRAAAQACCAGGSVITPGRLSLHEDALVGLQARAGQVLGNYDVGGRFRSPGPGESEQDLEQDVFGAVRLLERGQVALLVPLVETRRATSQASQLGAGIGDVNLSARYDLLRSGESAVIPGVAVLAGLTFPTGRAPEGASPPLLADATGIGAFQINGGLALEQTFGPWLVNLTGLVAQRTEHGGETLGTQLTVLAAGAYTFSSESSVALTASYALEGDAHAGGADVPNSSKSVLTTTLSGLVPLSDAWRLLGGVYLNPPLDTVGRNQPAALGLSLTAIRSWS